MSNINTDRQPGSAATSAIAHSPLPAGRAATTGGRTMSSGTMKVKLTNGDTIQAFKDEAGTYSACWQIGDKTGDCYQKADEVTDEVEEEGVKGGYRSKTGG